MERAKAQYALEHNMNPEQVTEKMLADSDEGVEGYACRGLDLKARSPLGNQMYRQFQKSPAAKECYKWLTDDVKLKFRQSWAMERSFDFVLEKRIRSVGISTKHREEGSWKNELQLQQYYGGIGNKEAERQASNYIRNCEKWPELQGESNSQWFCSAETVS